MITWINKFADKCVEREYITEGHAQFLKYELERRYVCVVVGIPFFLLGSAISSLPVVFSFYVGFYLLRTRIGGFHAKNIRQCLVTTLISELLFLGFLPRILTMDFLFTLLFISSVFIFCFAPYQDPNMGFSDEELIACANYSKVCVGILVTLVFFLYWSGYMALARGMTLGIVLAAALLAFAYVDQKLKERMK